MREEQSMSAGIENGDLIIRIPVNLLVFAAENNPEYLEVKITDQYTYAKEVAKRILEFNEDPDTGTTQFQQLLDDIQGDLVEDANDVLKVKWSPDDDFE